MIGKLQRLIIKGSLQNCWVRVVRQKPARQRVRAVTFLSMKLNTLIFIFIVKFVRLTNDTPTQILNDGLDLNFLDADSYKKLKYICFFSHFAQFFH